MRPTFAMVRHDQAAAITVPWWQARWLKITGRVLWWLLTFAWEVAVATVAVLMFLGGVLLIMVGVFSHFVKGPPERW